MKNGWVEVVLGRMRMRVPVIVDEATTRRAVEQVNARLALVEKQSQRVDTLEFALLAALSFACELEETKRAIAEEREQLAETSTEDAKEFFQELDKIAEALNPTPKKQGPRLLK